MALQYSTTLRDNQLDAIETTTGASPKLYIRTASSANCGAADAGSLLCTIDLPANWLADAGTGSKALAGVWSGTAGAGGTAAFFRIKDSTGTTCHLQGTITASGGGGDMTLDNTTIANLQTVTVTTFTISAGNA